MTPFKTHDDITARLNAARNVGIKAMSGAPATPAALASLASRIYCAVLEDVALGGWAKLGVVDPDNLGQLTVSARLGKTITEPPIVIEWDFSRTKLGHLLVGSVMASGVS